MSRLSYQVVNVVFSRGRRGGTYLEGGRLFQTLSLRRSANSMRGVYLKLDADSSIYGISQTLHF